ncbi:hypothetical protein ABH935_009807 [Catenulispora sp. GAS73]|uniref:hypothetical protein n=1 Tax=Catenulispora sp. GAS73 TaxID=3156269 RepID=UPI003512D5DC
MQHQAIALPALPPSVIRIVRIGIPISLLATEALSFQSLYSLGLLVGWSCALAWLLPVALDVYAAVSTAVWQAIPDEHEASKPAARNARFAICLTEGGNALNHLANAGGNTAHMIMVLSVSALPPLIAERLLRLAAFLPKPEPEAVPEAEPITDVASEAELAEPQNAASIAPKPKAPSKPTAKQQEIIAALREADDATTSETIAAKVGVTDSYVRQVRRKLQASPALAGA